MDRLLLCEACRHGATGHVATGCEVANCPCPITGDRIVENAIRTVTDEIQKQYRDG